MELMIGSLVGLVIGLVIAMVFVGAITRKKLKQVKGETQKIVADASREAETLKKEKLIEAEEQIFELKHRAEKEVEALQIQFRKLQEDLDRKEINIDRKADIVEKKEKELEVWKRKLSEKEAYVSEKSRQVNELISEQTQKLEELSGLTREEAKRALIEKMESAAREEGNKIASKIIEESRMEATRKAREIVVQAIQQVAAEQSVEATVSVITLPSDDMKGRIIGREGRNIRAFELVTGVDVIIDDTPEIVLLSSYNTFRREVARRALQKLITDGRIHPARIEEVVEKTTEEVRESMQEIGEQALLEAGVHGVAPELAAYLGKLQFRTAYGQNVLNHSLEVAYLCGIMAAELNMDAQLAKRAGIFHDIGKAIEHYSENDHALLGADLLRKFNEHEVVINAAEAHHNDREATNAYTLLVASADVISGKRPGARRESLENFLKRMCCLEDIAKKFDGIEKAFAIQAGKEVRVIVETNKVDDYRARELPREIAQKIAEEAAVTSPLKVTVIREFRAYDYAT